MFEQCSNPQVDRFYTGAEARYDRWRTLLQQAREWEMSAKQKGSEESHRAQVVKSLEELRQWEDFYAYPGAPAERGSTPGALPARKP